MDDLQLAANMYIFPLQYMQGALSMSNALRISLL